MTIEAVIPKSETQIVFQESLKKPKGFRVEREIVGPGNGAVARFNAAKFGDLIAYRVNSQPPQEEMPDLTDSIGLSLDLGNNIVPYGEVLKRANLPENILNLEDLRAHVYGENGQTQVLFGGTAVGKDKKPYPAIVRAKPPFGEEDFSQPEIIEGLSYGKNVTFFDENTMVYRKETDGEAHELTVVKNENGKWVEKQNIQFPKGLDWCNFRIGLTGSQWLSKEENKGRMLIHGVKKTPKYDKDLKFSDTSKNDQFQNKVTHIPSLAVSSEEDSNLTYPDGESKFGYEDSNQEQNIDNPPNNEALNIVDNFESSKLPYDEYEYGFGVAEFKWDRNFENMRLTGISKDAVLSYDQMQEIYKEKFGNDQHEELNSYKKVIYSCDGGEQRNGRTHILVTYGDTQVVEVSCATKELTELPLERVN